MTPSFKEHQTAVRHARACAACLAFATLLATVPLGASSAGQMRARRGNVHSIDGQTGEVVRTYPGQKSGDEYGAAITIESFELWIGAPGASVEGESSGAIYAVDEQTRTKRRKIDANNVEAGAPSGRPLSRLGQSAANLGHINSDSLAWLAFGAPAGGDDNSAAPSVVVIAQPGETPAFADRDRREVYRLEGPPDSLFGWAVVQTSDDINGDGFVDLIVGAPRQANGTKAEAGRVSAYAAATGTLLWSTPGPGTGDHLGFALARTCDIDGDGVRDILAGAPGLGTKKSRGKVFALSARTGRVIRTIAPKKRTIGLFGFALSRQFWLSGRNFVGAPASGKANEGAVFELTCERGSVRNRVNGESAGQRLGIAVDDYAGRFDAPLGYVLAGSVLGDELRGQAQMVNPKTRETLQQSIGKRRRASRGHAVVRIYDTNFDGQDEYLVTELGLARYYIPGEGFRSARQARISR